MTGAMSEERLREIEERAKLATEGPWRAASPDIRCVIPEHCGNHPGGASCKYEFQGWTGGSPEDPYFSRFVSSEATKEELVGSDDYGPQLTVADAAFIAHSRQDIPDLLAEVRRLRAAQPQRGEEK